MESGGELTKRGGEVDGVTCSSFVVVQFLLGDFCCWIWGIEACVLFARPFVVACTTIVTILFFVSVVAMAKTNFQLHLTDCN